MPAQSHGSRVPPEQAVYATVLAWGTGIGFVALVAGFALYASGIVPPHVPLDRLPALWELSAADFLRETGQGSGWGWLQLAHRGDVMNLGGIAWLAGCSVACLAAVIPTYRARGEGIYVALCALEIAVIALAASGILNAGH